MKKDTKPVFKKTSHDIGGSILDDSSSICIEIKEQPRTAYNDSDFWFHKGVVLNEKNESKHALSCYKQALKLNSKHLPSIFNLACGYEKLKQYEKAVRWFRHAINVKKDWA